MLLDESLRPPTVAPETSEREDSQHACSAFHAVADFDVHGGGGVEHDIYTRTKFDQSHALPALDMISDFLVEDDAAREQSCDLLEDDGLPVAFDRDNVLLVLFGRGRIHGIEKLSVLIMDFPDHAGQRGAVHVDIEDIEKDADPGTRNSVPTEWKKCR